MRFHHSTRRGRTKFSQPGGAQHASGGRAAASHSALSARWAQLSYCRQTNIHFNRRLPVDVPDELRDPVETLPANSSVDSNYCTAEALPATALPHSQAGAELEQRLGGLHLERGREQAHEMLATDSEPAARPCGLKKAPAGSATHQTRHQHDNKTATTTSTAAGRKLDIEDARERLIAQVEKHPFWSNKAAKRMRLLDIDERRILVYELVSYCERRDLEWRYEPCRGGLATGASSNCGGQPSPARRVFSSASAHESAAERLMAGSSAMTSTVRQLSADSQSQPASPLRVATAGANSSADRKSLGLQARVAGSLAGDSAYEPTASPSPASSSALPPLGSPQSHDQPRVAEFGNRRPQAIRRSCSSATSSPGHSSCSPTHLGTAPATPSWHGEPRPLPSPQLVWSIEPPEHLRPAPFVTYMYSTEVPESSFVKRCHGCQGRGRLKCTSCYGVGYEVCLSCSGKGTTKSLVSASATTSAGHAHQRSGGDSAIGGGIVGGMWGDSGDSPTTARLGQGRREEPGGISGGGSPGPGSWTSEACHLCHGAGQKRCWICAGRAYNICTACAGTGQLRCYLNLNISWLNHRDECVLNNTDAIIPRDRLSLTSGLQLADEVAARLAPIAAAHSSAQLRLAAMARAESGPLLAPPASEALQQPAPDGRPPQDGTPGGAQHLLEQVLKPNELSQLQSLSSRLLEKHAQTYGRGERLLKQRQRVTQIECHRVNWEWKRRRGHFVIYGDERKVYIAKYPFKSICSIT